MEERSDRFDKFTERARKVLSLAHEEAARFNHNYIGTEHLLLGLVREGDGVAAQVLKSQAVQLQKVRASVEHIVGRGKHPAQGEIGLTPRARRVIELAFDEARRQNHHYIGTEHLLLGVVREGEGVAVGVLESLGVSLEGVRAQVIQVINQSTSYSQSRPIPRAEPGVETAEPDRSDILTERALQALVRARDEADRLGHERIGTGHILVGLLMDGECLAAQLLSWSGVDLVQVRQAHQALGERPDASPNALPRMSEHTFGAVAVAVETARLRATGWAATVHLLVGLLEQEEDTAVAVLRSLDVDTQRLRDAAVRLT